MKLSLKTIRNLGFLVLVTLALFVRANTAIVDACDLYCGDGICEDGGCRNCGCDSPGDGCRENAFNCPLDCS
jgi:hypothetical protein